MTMTQAPAPHRSARRPSHADLGRSLVGGFFLVMGGVHLGLVAADPRVYEHFADHGLFGFVRTGWLTIVMATPTLYGLLLMAGEVTAGTLLLVGGRAAAVGWAVVIAFHVLLMFFGWWTWAWCLPALALLAWLANRDLRSERGLS
jgi:hypothetical protein